MDLDLPPLVTASVSMTAAIFPGWSLVGGGFK